MHFKPVIIYNFLQSARLLGRCSGFVQETLCPGLLPNEKNIQAHLENSLMLATALVPELGYDKAAVIAKKAHAEGITLEQAVCDLKYLTRDEFRKLVDPSAMTRPFKTKNKKGRGLCWKMSRCSKAIHSKSDRNPH